MIRRTMILTLSLAGCIVFSAAAETKKLTADDVLLLKSVDLEEAAILKRIADSGAVFSAGDLEKFKGAGFSDDFVSQAENLMKARPKPRKLSVAEVLSLKRLDVPEETILKKIKDSETNFSPEELQELKRGGVSDDFIARLRAPARAGEADLKKAREQFKKNIDELGDCFSSASETMEEFNRTFEELQSQKKEGKLAQRKFAQSLEKAVKTCGETLEETHATLLELKQSMDAAPPDLKEKKPGAKVASLADEYLATLKEALKGLEPVAKGTGDADEFESSLEAAAELKDKAEEAYKAYEALAAEEPAKKQLKADFSTPFLAVKTLFDACAAKDLNLLSQCFAEQAEEEFQAIRDKTIGPEDLNEFVYLFKGATIAAVKERGSSASVDVKLTGSRGQETFSLVKENGQWKIVEF